MDLCFIPPGIDNYKIGGDTVKKCPRRWTLLDDICYYISTNHTTWLEAEVN